MNDPQRPPVTLAEALQATKRIRERVGAEMICCGNPVPGHGGDGWMQPPDPPECCGCPDESVGTLLDVVVAALLDQQASAAQQARHQLLNTPELHSFSEGVTLEALHQRERWGADHDAGKTPADWFWLVGYLAGKALHAQTSGNTDKALHHTISTAAALANWHAAITGEHTAMRPGIDPAAHGVVA